jgi:dihydropteroate synthase
MAQRLSKSLLQQWRQTRGGNSIGSTRCGNMNFQWGERTYIMGIVNVSPDSFSGDGIADPPQALKLAHRLIADGADLIDIGGESTRPGTTPRSASEAIDEELRRVMPVIEKLAGTISVPISIDTYKSEVAVQALDAGAAMINDIWGLQKDPRLARLASIKNVPIILMSNQREKPCRYIIPTVIADLMRAINAALDAGVHWDNIIIDPGIGFGKTREQNLEIVSRFNELRALGRPLLLATSRKSFIGLTLDLPPQERMEGTAASLAIGISKGADMVRVHDVKEMARVCRLSDAIVRKHRSH